MQINRLARPHERCTLGVWVLRQGQQHCYRNRMLAHGWFPTTQSEYYAAQPHRSAPHSRGKHNGDSYSMTCWTPMQPR